MRITEQLKLFAQEGFKFSVVFRSRDYIKTCIVPVSQLDAISEDFYSYYTDLYSFAIPETLKIIEIPTKDLRRYTDKIVPLVYDVDLDIDPEIKRKIKEILNEHPNDEMFKRGLYSYKTLRAREIDKEIFWGEGLLMFSNTTTNFHALIPALYVLYDVWFSEQTLPIFYHEHRGWTEKILSKFPEYHTDPYNLWTKTYKVELIDLEGEIDYDAVRYFTDKVFNSQQNRPARNLAKLHDILPELVEMFKKKSYPYTETFGGEHHSLILHLAGELALSGWSLEEALEIYEKYFRPHDNPQDYRERIYNIKRTFQKVANGEPVQALRHLNWKWALVSRNQEQPRFLPTAQEILQKGFKKVYYPTDEGIKVIYTKNNRRKIDKEHTLSWRWHLRILKFQDQFVEYRIFNATESYTVKSPIPNTTQNIKEFENTISHLPLTQREVKILKEILQNAVAFRELWGAPTENQYNENTITASTQTGFLNAMRLWRSNPAYRLGISIAIAKYQNPDLINPIMWVYGETGVGKSYTLSHIADAFGVLVHQNATYNALETYASELNGKPLIIEDLAPFLKDPEGIKNLIFSGHFGRGKARRTNIAGSTLIYTRPISASIFLASEISPQTFLGEGETGVYRRILAYRLDPGRVEIIQGLYPDAKGWALLLSEIIPNDEDWENIPYRERHFRQLLPYVRAIYRVLNGLAGTNFNPDDEFKEAVLGETVKKELIPAKIRKWITAEFLKKHSSRLITVSSSSGEKVVLPKVFLDDMSREISVDTETILRITQWEEITVGIKNRTIKGYDVSDWVG